MGTKKVCSSWNCFSQSEFNSRRCRTRRRRPQVTSPTGTIILENCLLHSYNDSSFFVLQIRRTRQNWKTVVSWRKCCNWYCTTEWNVTVQSSHHKITATVTSSRILKTPAKISIQLPVNLENQFNKFSHFARKIPAVIWIKRYISFNVLRIAK